MFVDAYYLIADTIKYNVWNPVTSSFFDIHTGQWTNLNHWYNDVSVEENSLILLNSFDNRRFVIDNTCNISWIIM